MKLRTVLGVSALLMAAALPATSFGQRNHQQRPTGRGYYGSGPYHPSSINGNGYRNRYRGYDGPVRIGGIQVYFPRGGGRNNSQTYLNFNYGYQDFGYPGYGYPTYALPYGYSYGYGGYR